jgi:hypothetical protein
MIKIQQLPSVIIFWEYFDKKVFDFLIIIII